MNRIARTAIQLTLALCGVVPASVAILEENGIDVDTRGVVAIAGIATLVVTAVQNTLEDRGVIKDRRG